MIRWLAKRRMAAFERQFNYDLSYAREMLDASLPAFWRFSRIQGLASHRENVPLDAWYTAKIVATLSEDCGPCAQLVVSMAEREGVTAATLRAVVAGDESTMPSDVALAFRFARAALRRDVQASGSLREEVIARWGKRGLVSLALAIASSRVFPAIKYALGYGRACSRIAVAGAAVPLHQ